MKSILRSLHIDGETFFWRVVRLDAARVSLRLWREREGKALWASTVLPISDPWLHFADDATAVAKGNTAGTDAPREMDRLLPSKVADIIRRKRGAQ